MYIYLIQDDPYGAETMIIAENDQQFAELAGKGDLAEWFQYYTIRKMPVHEGKYELRKIGELEMDGYKLKNLEFQLHECPFREFIQPATTAAVSPGYRCNHTGGHCVPKPGICVGWIKDNK